ncbi:MAG: hypothetical protein HYW48_11025 [Deltaproteobacteria bacterium]|nr:hypothetical protein [Deltaproteobacteria bacterium]
MEETAQLVPPRNPLLPHAADALQIVPLLGRPSTVFMVVKETTLKRI